MNPDSPWFRGAVVLAGVVLIQYAVLDGFRIAGVRPDLLLGLALTAAVVAGPERGALVGFAGGIIGDLFVDTPFGLSALVACVIAFLAGSIQSALGADHRWVVPVLTAGGTVVAVISWAVLATVLGLPGLLRPHLILVALIVGTCNTAASRPLAAASRWICAGVPNPTRGLVGA